MLIGWRSRKNEGVFFLGIGIIVLCIKVVGSLPEHRKVLIIFRMGYPITSMRSFSNFTLRGSPAQDFLFKLVTIHIN